MSIYTAGKNFEDVLNDLNAGERLSIKKKGREKKGTFFHQRIIKKRRWAR